MTPNRMRSVLQALLVAAAVPAWAQSASLDGTWTATISKPGSSDSRAELVIKGAQGTWTILAGDAGSGAANCIARPFPVIVAAQPGGRWRLSIEAATTVRGCRNRRVMLKAVDAKTLAGELGSGHAVSLVRE
jgi:hypothetical protein